MSKEVKICGMEAEKGRWVLAIAGLMIELCLGSVYAYSIISVPLKRLFDQWGLTVSATAMQVPYIASLLVLSLTLPLVGQFIERFGPRKVSMVGGLLTGLGWFLTSMVTSPTTLAIIYGIVGGLGVGIAYNCPIATSARWFPDRCGFAVGLTLLGFGFSPALVGPIADYLAANCGGILNTFRVLGIAFMIIIVLLSTLLEFPPEDWTPKGWKQPEKNLGSLTKPELMRNEMIKTPTFYGLWICYAVGTLAGLMAIGVAKPVGLEVANNAGMAEATASDLMTRLIVPFAVFNGFGRPIFGWLTDKLGPAKTAILSYILILFASLLIYTSSSSIPAYTASFAMLWLCFGGWEGIAPAATASYFGTKDYPRNYGLVCTAYGAGAVIGNVLVGQAKDVLGAYVMVFPIVAVLAIFGLIAAVVLMKPKND